MKAAVVTDFRAPLQIHDVPVPEPQPGELLVRTETSGLCHEDMHARNRVLEVAPDDTHVGELIALVGRCLHPHPAASP